MLDPSLPLALYMEDASNDDIGKMGFGLLRYSPNPIVAVIDSNATFTDVAETGRTGRSVPIVPTVGDAMKLGAQVLVLGTAPSGGLIPTHWWSIIESAVRNGLSVINGLHDLVAPRFPHLLPHQWIWDIRVEPAGLSTGNALAANLTIPRVLMIGTDMAVGKMTAGLELLRTAREAGWGAEFIATGQIGIAISGRGVPLDAVRVDFASGAIEREVLAAAERLFITPSAPSEGEGGGLKSHIAETQQEAPGIEAAPGTQPPAPGKLIIVEGQGALIHPSSTANLPLLRGSCPTHLILCHRAGQVNLRRIGDIAIPPLRDYARLYEDLGEALGAFNRPKTIGVCLNTSHLDSVEAEAACRKVEDETGWPCVDPVREGSTRLLAALGPSTS